MSDSSNNRSIIILAAEKAAVDELPENNSADEELSELKGYMALPIEDKVKLLAVYTHTGLLVNELINLEYEAKDSVVKVKERSGERKDRYSSLSYNIWVSRQLEAEMKKPKNVFDPKTIISYGKKANLYQKLSGRGEAI